MDLVLIASTIRFGVSGARFRVGVVFYAYTGTEFRYLHFRTEVLGMGLRFYLGMYYVLGCLAAMVMVMVMVVYWGKQ